MTDRDQRLHTEDLAARREMREPTEMRPAETTGEAIPPPAASGAVVTTEQLPPPPPPPVQEERNTDGSADRETDGWTSLVGDTSEFAASWDRIQAGFVDEPRRAVEEADALVAQVIQRLADSFSRERSRLEGQWSRGDQVGTE